jgi:hypothetical protein
VRGIPIRGRDVLVMGDFNRSFKWNRGRARRAIKLDKWVAELSLLNDEEVPTRGGVTLDFVFSNVPGATGGLNEMQSGLDYGVM